MYKKFTKCPNVTWFLPEKLAEYPNFYNIFLKNYQNSRILHDFCPRNARILHNNCPKNICSPILRGARAPPPPLPMPPVFYAYARHSLTWLKMKKLQLILTVTSPIDLTLTNLALRCLRPCYGLLVTEWNVENWRRDGWEWSLPFRRQKATRLCSVYSVCPNCSTLYRCGKGL